MRKGAKLKFVAGFIIALSALLYFCEKDPVAPAPSVPPPGGNDTIITPFPVKQVNIIHYYFTPQHVITIRGASISWTNKDSVSHTVTSHTGLFDSGDLGPGKNYFIPFNNSGTFYYSCRYHREYGVITIQ